MPPRIDRRPTFASWVGMCLALVAGVAACSTPTNPHWADDGAHVVDGYWILSERPCDLASSDPCVAAVRTAETTMDIDPKAVVRGATAGLPRQWVRSDGRHEAIIENTSGSGSEFVVVDLADGTRRAIAYGCLSAPNPDGSMTCLAYPLDRYRVDHLPSD